MSLTVAVKDELAHVAAQNAAKQALLSGKSKVLTEDLVVALNERQRSVPEG